MPLALMLRASLDLAPGSVPEILNRAATPRTPHAALKRVADSDDILPAIVDLRERQAQVTLADDTAEANVTAAISDRELPAYYPPQRKYITAIRDLAASPGGKTVLLPGDLLQSLQTLIGRPLAQRLSREGAERRSCRRRTAPQALRR